jgi:ArsR family transcriptional regulator
MAARAKARKPAPHSHGARAPRYGAEALERAGRLFKSLGDPERLQILELLAVGEACVSELAESTSAELSAVSQRLRLLRAEGLVHRRREGKHIYYSLSDRHVAGLIHNALEHGLEPPGR